ncbi:MAG: cold shock and DUF1294 domain-containing protein [Burkholderiaceae bacterium]|nr:cold shock and DUF1294 domain-containing protein [Burkholderiaceae bacterium]
MNRTGQVIRWNEERGFGFIRGEGSPADVFFHVRDFRGTPALRPHEGLRVAFEEIHMGGKGPRAVAVRPLASAPPPMAPRPAGRAGRDGPLTLEPMAGCRHIGPRPASPPTAPQRTRRRPAASQELAPVRHAGTMLLLVLAYAAAIGWGLWTRRLPAWVLIALPGVNLGTFMAYWHDKHAAHTRQWRTPENTLHAWSLAGGWPAAWLAQQVLRHKSSKGSFQQGYVASVIGHGALLAGVLWWLDTTPIGR